MHRDRERRDRVVLAVETAGYLLTEADIVGRVHSVFAQACNVEFRAGLLTIGLPIVANGPLTLRLEPAATRDLRELFAVGERVEGGRDCLYTARAEIAWARAVVWHPGPRRDPVPATCIEARLGQAAVRLAQARLRCPSVLDREAAAAAQALGRACRTLTVRQAVRQVDRLIGWGEGLTPSGDDFLVGLLAGLDACPSSDAPRRDLRQALARAVVAGVGRTTPIAAHFLRLAAAGHYAEPLLDLRDALVSQADDGGVDAALGRALAIGATSGADAVSGLLGGVAAWVAPAPCVAAAA